MALFRPDWRRGPLAHLAASNMLVCKRAIRKQPVAITIVGNGAVSAGKPLARSGDRRIVDIALHSAAVVCVVRQFRLVAERIGQIGNGYKMLANDDSVCTARFH
jgi:hypothetical protein